MKRTYIDQLEEYYREKEEESEGFLSGWDWALQGFPSEEKQDDYPFPHRRLLVVDDEDNMRSTYARLFSYRGYDVLSAPDAVEARNILLKEKVDIVFLDINMPEVDGETLFEVIRTFHKDAKIVVSSVYPVEEQRERIKDADAYFDKSEAKTVLLKIVARLV